jgi:DNA-binding MarR family transcriptional regulator
MPPKKSAILSLEDQIVIALRRISQAIDVWSRQLWLDYGLTSPQLATLREILAGRNVSPVLLAAALHLSQPTVTGIMGRLEQRGLIRRERSTTDRRSVVATVTNQGRKLAAEAPRLLRDHFRHELAKLPTTDQSSLLANLQRVAGMMQAPEIGDGPFFFHDQEGKPESTASRPTKRSKKSGKRQRDGHRKSRPLAAEP